MPAYEFEGVRPVVDPSAFVHPTAVLIGDVIIGPRCFIGPGASLRGDIGRLFVGEGANIQDNCIVHCFPGKDILIEVDGHIGHGAVLHGCTIQRRALVGMNAVIMDDAVIGSESFVAAMAFVASGTRIPPRSLAAGIPAKVLRELRPDEIDWKSRGTAIYQHLARRYRATATECEPLAESEPDRPGVPLLENHPPKHERK